MRSRWTREPGLTRRASRSAGERAIVVLGSSGRKEQPGCTMATYPKGAASDDRRRRHRSHTRSSSPAAGSSRRTSSRSSTRPIRRRRPAATYTATEAQYDEAVEAAVAAFEVTRTLPAYERGRILREISAGITRPARGARPAHRARVGQADPRRPGRGRPRDADLPPRRRGSRADDRRADPARPDAGRRRTGSGSRGASRSARSRPSARSTSRSTWPPTSSRRRSPSGNPIVLKPPSKDPLTMLAVAEIVEAAGVAGGLGLASCR